MYSAPLTPQENVVYILGAGFSAPLGLPVMGNFITKAKDIMAYKIDHGLYYEQVFQGLDRLAKAKNYLRSDLFNIEEVLCILEMEAYVTGNKLSDNFIHFLADTIRRYTPPITKYGPELPGNWHDYVFGKYNLTANYTSFVANIFSLSIRQHKDSSGYRSYSLAADIDRPHKYGVISLNYDMVLENALAFLTECYNVSQEYKYIYANTVADDDPYKLISNGNIPLAKIHGSIDPLSIVAPTWNKMARADMQATWSLAHNLLRNANHIRILGYSLPASDTYFKYLLSTAVVDSYNIKTIDVICLDPTGEVEKRYNSIIDFKNFRFISEDISEYLDVARTESCKTGQRTNTVTCTHLEGAHTELFDIRPHACPVNT